MCHPSLLVWFGCLKLSRPARTGHESWVDNWVSQANIGAMNSRFFPGFAVAVSTQSSTGAGPVFHACANPRQPFTHHATGRRSAWVCLLLAGCFLGASLPAATGAEEDKARQILEASGFKGGFIAHVGCGDGKLTAALPVSEHTIVHGLDRDASRIVEARRHIRSLGLYGRVSVEQWDEKALPYVDNLVNLLVVENPDLVAPGEIMRVLAPDSAAIIRKNGEWVKQVKPRPENIDEWTHYLHDPSGNAVAHDDVVGPPRHYQWIGSPRWSRHHDHMASMSAMVSAGGRVFYIFDEGPTSSAQLPAQWSLVARDAFNGSILWRKPIEQWQTHFWPLKSGPAHLPRRLLAEGDTVYVTLGLHAPVTALDAATGEVSRTFAGTEFTQEMIFSDGVLLLSMNEGLKDEPEFNPRDTFVWDNTKRANRDWAWQQGSRVVMAVDAGTGATLWKKNRPVAPLTLASDGRRIYFFDGEKLVCLNRKTGAEVWISEGIGTRAPLFTSFAPRLVVYGGAVLFSTGKSSMAGYSAETGKSLWTSKQARSGHQSPGDLLVVDGLVWSGATAGGRDSGVFTGRNPLTGEIEVEFPPDTDIYWFHQRCYPSKATDKYLLPSRTGIEFIDYKKKTWQTHHWVRGGCIYGVMPCNGLVYTPPHSCACYVEAKLNGFTALAARNPNRALPKVPAAGERLVRGPAYDKILPVPRLATKSAWPTYRHDTARSGYTETPLSANLETAWAASLGGRLSALTVAQERVFVASVDAHSVHALDVETGTVVWTRATGGRVDSPPTYHEGRVLFGSNDGWVYCLRALDGELVWRFRAGPADHRMMAFEQLESVWPVPGSVLVQDGVLYCVAGRSMFLDGGLRMIRLDPETGRKLSENVLDELDPETGKNLQSKVRGLNMPVSLPDILSSDGKHIYMRSQRFDLEGRRQALDPRDAADQLGEGAHLFCTIGFLDDSWFHRSYWLYGKTVTSGWGGWFKAGRFVPSGRILVTDGSSIYGYARQPAYMCQSPVLEYHLYSARKEIDSGGIQRVTKTDKRINQQSEKRNATAADWGLRRKFSKDDLGAIGLNWSQDAPVLQVRSMAAAAQTLFVAGPPDLADEEKAFYFPNSPEVLADREKQAAALRGSRGALLQAISTRDGKTLAQYRLDALPVYDSMALAHGRLFLSLKNGQVLCMRAK